MSDIVERLRLRKTFVTGQPDQDCAEAAARIIELEDIGNRLWIEQREIASEVPSEFSLVPPDGGDVKTYEAVRAMADEITRLRAEVKRLRAALTPFAGYLDTAAFDLNGNGEPLPNEKGMGWVYLTVGDFRRARDAMGEKG